MTTTTTRKPRRRAAKRRKGQTKPIITVWNWLGDTDAKGEPIPRIIYRGPAEGYQR